jgi:death-on-curing family protein
MNEISSDDLKLIRDYSKTWRLLLAYDEEQLEQPKSIHKATSILDYHQTLSAIQKFKCELSSFNQSNDLFGNERDHGLQAILGNIAQSFADQPLYPTVEERAAHLLYFIIKDHPFSDGNKRIACLLFLMYLNLENYNHTINDNALVTLAIVVAQSDPKQKDLHICLINHLLTHE